MKKVLAVIAITAAIVSAPAMAVGERLVLLRNNTPDATPVAGFVPGTVATLQAVLKAPGLTLGSIIGFGAPEVIRTVAVVQNVSGALPAILTGRDVLVSSQDVSLRLPGPAFLNMTLVELPGKVAVNATGAGPFVVTVTTGPQ